MRVSAVYTATTTANESQSYTQQ